LGKLRRKSPRRPEDNSRSDRYRRASNHAGRSVSEHCKRREMSSRRKPVSGELEEPTHCSNEEGHGSRDLDRGKWDLLFLPA